MLRVRICPDTLAILYEAGENIANIADQFGCDPKTIRRRAKALGLRHPNSPQQTRKRIEERLYQLNAIQRYQDGETLMGLAAAGDTSIDTLRAYLKRNGVKIRTLAEQTAVTMKKYSTRFHNRKENMRLYVYERDAYGLVTKVKIYQGNNPNPIVRYP